MNTVAEALPSLARARLRAGDTFTARELLALTGRSVRVPDARSIVHLQLRRYAGCPICNLHLRSFTRRKDELDRAGLREVVVFHSSADELRRTQTELPFDVVPDPTRQLYDALGVTSSPRALLDPRVWGSIVRAAVAGASADPSAGRSDGPFGLPADFLVAPSGRVLAVKYGVHADDQWSVDDLLALAASEAAS